MSVVTDLYLPDQPDVGETQIVPLGGDGRAAPSSQVYTLISSSSDASGGTNRIRIRFEEVHAHMLAWVACQVDGTASDRNGLVNLLWGQRGESLADSVPMLYTPESGATKAFGLWRPPPLIFEPKPRNPSSMTGPYVEFYVTNTDTQTLTIGVLAYQFMPNTRSQVPFPILAANFPS